MKKKDRIRPGPPSTEVIGKLDNYHRNKVVVILSDRTVAFDAVRVNAGRDSAPYAPQDCPSQYYARSPAQRAKRRARTGRK